MNFKRTMALKLLAGLVILILLMVLSKISIQPSQWWTGGIVISVAIIIIVMIIIIVAGEIHESDDNDVLDQ